jgi:hypothetical protein
MTDLHGEARNYLAAKNVKSLYGVIQLAAKPLWLLSGIAPWVSAFSKALPSVLFDVAQRGSLTVT